MPADNSTHLVTAARRRRELTRAKAIRTLQELDHQGAPITFETVAGNSPRRTVGSAAS